ncbi:Bax inhibitor-1/YccA family protein [Vicingaceae bacterium]|nr:Bax inhibitor-1/YccA family protein [Vicingaceae bacterium]MDC1451705.1 Bax inhibitor-1/YccA family protein [Vicingaceae bacterium]
MIDYSNNNSNIETSGVQTKDAVSTFLANVFTYMGGALAITGLLAYWFGSTPSLITYLINPLGGATILGYIVMFSPLAFVLVMSFAFKKLSSFALLGLFILYAAVMGLSMSFIFLAYTASSIASTFFITAATFGVMAVLGYTTKQDLTKFGSILIMALIGIIIASVVNMFLGNGMLDIIISCVGVLVFIGLTAYDVQKLKRIGAGVEYGSESSNKLAIMGALNLYLDFVNLFMMLLRLFGDRR